MAKKKNAPASHDTDSQTLSHLRRFILITLTHAEAPERHFITKQIIMDRVRALLNCQRIIIARENHEANGYHFHAALQCSDASKNTAAVRRIRQAFPEFPGRQCNVSTWFSAVRYARKDDPEPLVFDGTMVGAPGRPPH